MANKSLYVGNMSYSTQESTLRALFEAYGPIGDVRIIGDKGFAFVEIPEENMAAAIEANNGKNVDGRPLTINEARPRTERSGGDRGGYRGNGGGGGYGGGDRGGYGGGDRGGRGGYNGGNRY